MASERRLFLLAVILLHSMNNYTNAVKDKEYIQEISTGKEIVGDGNCFYRSLSFYLFGHQNEHSTIRENVILYMSGGGGQTEAEKEERSRRYGRLMQNRRQSYEDYLRLHSNNGEWADEPIIQAAADLYGINIYVSSYGNSGVDQLVRATSEQLSRDSLRLVHLRLESSHYTCIEHDCQTDSVPSGDFFELQDVIELGKQNGAKPYEDSLDVLDYNKIVGLPKTLGDGESSNGGIDRFNMEDLKSNLPLMNPRKNDHIDNEDADFDDMDSSRSDILPEDDMDSSRSDILPETVGIEESRKKNDENYDGFKDLAKKKTINTVTEVQERELENQKDEDLENQFCWIDTEDEEPVEEINEVLCEDIRNITIAEEKTPKQKYTRCRDIEHLKELCKTGQVNCGTECRVRRTRLGHEYHHYFMIWEVLKEGLNIVQLTLTWPFRICFEILGVSFTTGHVSLLDFQKGVFIACADFPVNRSQIEAMRCRLEEMISCTHINYSLISKSKFYCQSAVSYIKTGEKNFSEVENFVGRYPIQGPIIILSVSFLAFLSAILTNCMCFVKKVKSRDFKLFDFNKIFKYCSMMGNIDVEFTILLLRAAIACISNICNYYRIKRNNNNNNKKDKTD